MDVAAEAHRAIRLGLDHRLHANADCEDEDSITFWGGQAARRAQDAQMGCSTEGGSKHAVDVFGQSHPSVATDTFQCLNCERLVTAGRYAPHLEKCMGKGRNASRVANRNLHSQSHKRQRASPAPSTLVGTSAGVVVVGAGNVANTTPDLTPDGSLHSSQDLGDASSQESQDDEAKDMSYGPPAPGRMQQQRRSTFAPSRKPRLSLNNHTNLLASEPPVPGWQAPSGTDDVPFQLTGNNLEPGVRRSKGDPAVTAVGERDRSPYLASPQASG
eukprot:SM000239S08061  [mRNA]  locus=s239:57892:59138:+ [translate_table: standard]